MNKPNFDAMTKAELRAYVIAHQQDKEAFYAFVDRLEAQRGSNVYPASMTPEEMHKVILEMVEHKARSRSES